MDLPQIQDLQAIYSIIDQYLSQRTSSLSPLVPWSLTVEHTDKDPFLGYDIGLHYDQWQGSTFSDLLVRLDSVMKVSAQPSHGALPSPIAAYGRLLRDMETPLDISEISTLLSSLSPIADPSDAQKSATLHRTRLFSRKLAAGIIAKQLALHDSRKRDHLLQLWVKALI